MTAEQSSEGFSCVESQAAQVADDIFITTSEARIAPEVKPGS